MDKILTLSLVWIFLGTVFGGGESIAASEYTKGKALYNDKCVLCHGKGGEGNGPGAVAFNPKPANFADPKFWQGIDDKTIAEIITKGKGMMPPFDLSPGQVKALTEYLKHFKK